MADLEVEGVCCSSHDVEDLSESTACCKSTAMEEPVPEECRKCPANWVCHYKGPNGESSGCDDNSWNAFHCWQNHRAQERDDIWVGL
ncbi:hypothetical protein FOZ60_002408 [Perkinsus olseni]|uniref:Uncharacterized protein n=1 Tax=Perkinsus olseni TaxID=32597 RepID=A0A7J6NZ65_PEROL|nr:hypothetical protein FOZ60_002408 [Perkinsus olseni]